MHVLGFYDVFERADGPRFLHKISISFQFRKTKKPAKSCRLLIFDGINGINVELLKEDLRVFERFLA